VKEKLARHLEQTCRFDDLKDQLGDEKKLAAYMKERFAVILDPLFVTGDMPAQLFGDGNLLYGAAHLWSYRFYRRVGQYAFPPGVEKREPTVRAIKESFFDKEKRAKYSDLTNVLSKRKPPIVFRRGTLEQMRQDRDFDSPELVIPEDVLYPGNLRPANYTDFDVLKDSLQRVWDHLTSSADTPELTEFHDYLVRKFDRVMGVDVPSYQPKLEILRMFPPILLERSWQYLYRFTCNTVPDKPAGGFFVRLLRKLGPEQVDALQYVCNVVFGKLAIAELPFAKDDAGALSRRYKAAIGEIR
jgi:hypothetical protein